MKKLGLVVLAVLLVAAAVAAYAFFKAPEAASGPITAVPIPTLAAEPVSAVAVVNTSEPAQPATGSGAAATVFELLPGESEARFIINEVLRGTPTTVVGRTDQVAAQLAVDPGDLSTAQVGVVQVNARTIATDNSLRNRAIQNRILRTAEFEFVTFAPRAVLGLTGAGSVGQGYDFQIVGDLTIAGVTREVTFDVTATPVSASRIEGLATTEFLYRDFRLAIPDSPSVDTVEDQVRLELQFVAEAVG